MSTNVLPIRRRPFCVEKPDIRTPSPPSSSRWDDDYSANRQSPVSRILLRVTMPSSIRQYDPATPALKASRCHSGFRCSESCPQNGRKPTKYPRRPPPSVAEKHGSSDHLEQLQTRKRRLEWTRFDPISEGTSLHNPVTASPSLRQPHHNAATQQADHSREGPEPNRRPRGVRHRERSRGSLDR